ncbi:glycosyltransferase [Balneolales bacterium ANBcel1]|nr:glycosyltransferase [Balneolales bacterium ANBcel1]
MATYNPLVSCLLPAGTDYSRLARSIHCYQQQSWKNKELIVIDSGHRDIMPLLEDIPSNEVRHIRAAKKSGYTESSLLNLGVNQAEGDMIAYWGETEWHHPDRIQTQVDAMTDTDNACVLHSTLLHLDHPEYVHHPYSLPVSGGYAGSLVVRNRNDLHFPKTRKDAKQRYLKFLDETEVCTLDDSMAWLMIRCLEGGSKSDGYKAFVAGLRDSPKSAAWKFWLTFRGKSLATHPRFSISEKERQAFYRYLKESQRLGLIRSITDGHTPA